MRVKYLFIATLVAFLFFVEDAHAYLDPGTASMILQGLIGGIVAGLVVIRMYWTKIKTFFLSRSGKKQQPQEIKQQSQDIESNENRS